VLTRSERNSRTAKPHPPTHSLALTRTHHQLQQRAARSARCICRWTPSLCPSQSKGIFKGHRAPRRASLKKRCPRTSAKQEARASLNFKGHRAPRRASLKKRCPRTRTSAGCGMWDAGRAMADGSQQPAASRVAAHPQNRPTANAENPGFDGDLILIFNGMQCVLCRASWWVVFVKTSPPRPTRRRCNEVPIGICSWYICSFAVGLFPIDQSQPAAVAVVKNGNGLSQKQVIFLRSQSHRCLIAVGDKPDQ
jgi:hypothetical protein